MRKTYFKNFIIYLSDYLSLALFLLTVFFIFYFLIFDTSYLALIGIFENELLLGVVCAVSSLEISGLFLSCNYFRLKKMIHFSRTCLSLNLNVLTRFIALRIVSMLIRIASLIVFFSPFLLSLSGIAILVENGISEAVFYVLIIGCVCIFIVSALSFSVFIQNLTFLQYDFIKAPFMSFKKLFRMSFENSDGNLLKLFKLKLKNLPKKLLSFLIFPAIYCLPSCLYDVYDFIYEKENPYPHKMNTGKSVIFYFEPIKGI